MKVRMTLQACANRRSSLARFMARRTEAAENCRIVRAVSAAEGAALCAISRHTPSEARCLIAARAQICRLA